MALAGTNLSGGVALITGGASGLGRETVFAFVEAGVEGIIIADLNEPAQDILDRCRELSRSPNFNIISVKIDTTREADLDRMIEVAVGTFGRIDYCVHAAGVLNTSWTTIQDLDISDFDRTMTINTRGTMLVLRAVSKAMAQQAPRTYTSPRNGTTRSLGRGAIVVIASLAAHIAPSRMMPYVGSKYATLGIAKVAATDNLPSQIRVNAISPSWTDTPMLEPVPGIQQVVETTMPLKRMALPEEVADSAVFLCSPSASFINGTVLVIDAGQSNSSI
ncbi:oxidoreductase [Aspergillus pseudoustus]|uniref:Oxidoreductase n=1 Tax=Aspergillus pseudoustus TaxID=1810923 RepID=A0ABR4IGR4_9EURO